MGNTRAIEVGEVQVMSAGTGLTHSEFNDSKLDEVNFLQLWIIPEQQNVEPNYEQKKFPIEDKINSLQTLVAPKDKIEGDALPINQQAYIYRAGLEAGKTLDLKPKSERNGLYVFNLEGALKISKDIINSRDAIGVYDFDNLSISAEVDSELLIIEVPMI